MKNFRTLCLAIALMAAFAVPAWAGEINTPGAPAPGDGHGPGSPAPGEINTPGLSEEGDAVWLILVDLLF